MIRAWADTVDFEQESQLPAENGDGPHLAGASATCKTRIEILVEDIRRPPEAADEVRDLRLHGNMVRSIAKYGWAE